VEWQPLVCEVLRRLGKETMLVIDHDQSVQGEFDRILDLKRDPHTGRLVIAPESAADEEALGLDTSAIATL
jgi:hypothetical protein